jgi:hypothetical protein
MKNLLREPLLHFFVLGAILFAAYGAINRTTEPQPQAITVSAGQVEHLATVFSNTWQRPPTPEELRGLIDQFVREEIFSREAVKLGLDQNDTVIRRRLQQKMEFVSEDISSLKEPTDAELAQYLAQHPDAFRQDARHSFHQIFLNAEKRGDRVQADVDALLTQLRAVAGSDGAADMGDSTLLPRRMTGESQRKIEGIFGAEFARALGGAKVGEWIGPIRSSYGLHLVRVDQRDDGRLPELAEVREAVQREWANEHQTEAARRFYETLKSRYQVTVQWPEPAANGKTAAR